MSNEKTFDLSALEPASETMEIEIYHPKLKTGTGIFIEIYGKDSALYRSTVKEQQNRRLRQMRKSRNLDLTSDEIEVEALELLVVCTKSWRTEYKEDGKKVSVPTVKYAGQALDFSEDNVRTVYQNVPIIKEQVDDGVQDRLGFMKG